MLLNDCNGSPIEIAANKTATIVLSGENKMTAFAAGPGILVNQGATLMIQGSSDASLTVYGAKQDEMYDSGDASADSRADTLVSVARTILMMARSTTLAQFESRAALSTHTDSTTALVLAAATIAPAATLKSSAVRLRPSMLP